MDIQELESKRWWRDDPHVNSKRLGVVLHQKDHGWVVAKVLKQSPAESAGICVDDLISGIGSYSLFEPVSDLSEALQLLSISVAAPI